jgi:hypothetical protein
MSRSASAISGPFGLAFRALLDRNPFAIGFVVGVPGGEPPLVVVVAHLKRRPGYWFQRTPKRAPNRKRRR